MLSLLPTILEQANKTIEKLKKSKRKDEPAEGGDGTPAADPQEQARQLAARVAELETAAMQQAENVKLLAEQHAITIDALRKEAARLDRRLRLMTGVAMAGFALGLPALVIAINLLLR
ncbi:Transmembrane protein [Cupriavidus sp. H18C1]